MTDKLTPGMLRDLADIIDAIPSGEYGAPHFREEAARREAEQLDPVGTASLAASLAQSEDKIAKAVEYLAQIPGSVYTPNTLPMGLALTSAAELAAVFVAAAEEDRLYLELKRKERDDDVPDAEFQRMWTEYRRAQARKREALQRAAEKVLA